MTDAEIAALVPFRIVGVWLSGGEYLVVDWFARLSPATTYRLFTFHSLS